MAGEAAFALPAIDAANDVFNSAANIYLAIRQEKFQERMSNTAVQRQVADMKKAGINPLLAVSGGMKGASTPTGSGMSLAQPKSLTNAYVQASMLAENLKAQKFQNEKTLQETGKIIAERRLTNATTKKLQEEDTEKVRREVELLQSEDTLKMFEGWIKGKEWEYIMNENSGKSLEAQKKQLENSLMQYDVELGQKLKSTGQLAPLIQILVNALGGRK